MSPVRTLLRGTAARGAAALGGGAAVGQGLALLSAPLLTRLYDVDGFGVFGGFSALVACLAAAATLRLDQAIVTEATEQGAEDVLRLCLLAVAGTAVLGGAGGALWAALRPGHMAGHGAGAWGPGVVAMLAPSILVAGALPALSLWFARAGRFRATGLYQASRSGFAVLVQGVLGVVAPGGTSLVGGQVLGQSLATGLLVAADGRRMARVVRRGWDRGRLLAALRRHRDFVVYGAPQALLRLLNTSLPVMLLPLLCGPAAGGLFWLAYRMLVLPQQVLVEALRPVFFREAARLHAEGRDLQARLPALRRADRGGRACRCWWCCSWRGRGCSRCASAPRGGRRGGWRR